MVIGNPRWRWPWGIGEISKDKSAAQHRIECLLTTNAPIKLQKKEILHRNRGKRLRPKNVIEDSGRKVHPDRTKEIFHAQFKEFLWAEGLKTGTWTNLGQKNKKNLDGIRPKYQNVFNRLCLNITFLDNWPGSDRLSAVWAYEFHRPVAWFRRGAAPDPNRSFCQSWRTNFLQK